MSSDGCWPLSIENALEIGQTRVAIKIAVTFSVAHKYHPQVAHRRNKEITTQRTTRIQDMCTPKYFFLQNVHIEIKQKHT